VVVPAGGRCGVVVQVVLGVAVAIESGKEIRHCFLGFFRVKSSGWADRWVEWGGGEVRKGGWF